MIQTGFYLGDRDWWIMASLGISSEKDLHDVYVALLAVGVPDYKAQQVCMTLSKRNTGYTLTDYDGHYSLMFVSEGTSAEQTYDSIDHEKKHLVEHICNYYGVSPKSEESAYLAGELGKLMFPAIAMTVCPVCDKEG